MRFRIQAGAMILLVLWALKGTGAVVTQANKFSAVPQIGADAGGYDLPTLWRSVESVVFLRIEKTLETRTQSVDGRQFLWIAHRALVHEAFRRFLGNPRSHVDLLERREAAASADPGYLPDREFVAFLRWNGVEQMFEPYVMIPVTEGRVKSPLIRALESGMNLEAFLKILRSMME